MKVDNIVRVMRSQYPVSDASLDRLLTLLRPCRFAKRELLVSEGVKCGYAYFIEEGMTRSYWVVDGEEFTTSFTVEGAIVFSMDELYYGQISQEYVEALEPIVAYGIAIDDLTDLFVTDIDFANWGRVIHQNEYRRIHRSHKERLTLPAASRYREFVKQFPEVCRRANLGYIASYLGITLSTLSRLRKS